MNETTVRETQLRSLRRRIAGAHRIAAQQTGQRETATRQYGSAHPRSIEATHRLSRTQSAHRGLLRMYRTAAGELARLKGHQRV